MSSTVPPGKGGSPADITTADSVETSLGALEFKDGAPSAETVTKVYDNLDLMHAVEAFLNAYQGASTSAIRKGLISAGVNDNTVLIFSKLMDAQSLFLTANADTIYFWSILDVTSGPIVLETPPMALGVIDDMWFHWVTDFGLPGPDRGAGGKYLLVPPGYTGELPDSGYFVAKMRTTRAIMLGRSFLENDAPEAPVELIKKTLKIYPYQPGGYGTSIGAALGGTASLKRAPEGHLDWSFLKPQPPATFVEGSGLVMSTIPPNDATYYDLIDELVQAEPSGALDPEIMNISYALLSFGGGASFAAGVGTLIDPHHRVRRRAVPGRGCVGRGHSSGSAASLLGVGCGARNLTYRRSEGILS